MFCNTALIAYLLSAGHYSTYRSAVISYSAPEELFQALRHKPSHPVPCPVLRCAVLEQEPLVAVLRLTQHKSRTAWLLHGHRDKSCRSRPPTVCPFPAVTPSPEPAPHQVSKGCASAKTKFPGHGVACFHKLACSVQKC